MDEKMIQTKCRNGHYFDREEFIYCPICGSESNERDIIQDHKKMEIEKIFSLKKTNNISCSI